MTAVHTGYTIVFEKNNEAIREVVPGKLNPDGTPVRRYNYILNRGSSRSSKTHSIIQMFWFLAWEFPGLRMAVFRSTKKATRDTVFKDMKKIYPNMPGYHAVSLNKTELIWEFPNGSVIEINGTDEPEKMTGYNSDIIWLNEPYKMSEEVFHELDQRAAWCVIIDINPRGEHWSNDLLRSDDCKFIYSTFKDNPFCPPKERRKILSYQPVECSEAVMKELVSDLEAYEYDLVQNQKNLTKEQLRELARCVENQRKKTASKYRWYVNGLGLKADRPNRIFHWEEISDEDYRKLTYTKYYFSDWGAVDPWAVGEVMYHDGHMYIKELNYLSENEIRERMSIDERAKIQSSDEGIVPYMFNKMGIPKQNMILCDNNRPMKIKSLRSHGWDFAVAVDAFKYDGSIIDGISILEDITVHYTSSSVNVMMEQEAYSRKTDRLGTVLEYPEDADNHCFVGDTMITTIKGQKKIDEINKGDLVLTRTGYRPVIATFENGVKEVFRYRMQFDTFLLYLVCTPNHKIQTKEHGWLEISKLESGMTATIIKPSMEKNTNSTRVKDILDLGSDACIGMCGNTIVEKEKKVSTYITLTKTHGTTDLKISNSKRKGNIDLNMEKIDSREGQSGVKISIGKGLRQPKNGMLQKKDLRGIENLQSRKAKKEKASIRYVNNAEQSFMPSTSIKTQVDSVQTIANQNGVESMDLMTLTDNVNAAIHLESINIQEQKIVGIAVESIGLKSVYDLMIHVDHEYFANGMLVRNCIDGVRYVAMYLRAKGIIRK